MLLEQSTTFIIGPIAKLLGVIIDVIYNGLSAIGIENVAICIVLFTIIVQVLMIPLKYKSQKFTRLTAMIQPEINEIRKKYQGKKDQQSMTLMQQETQEVYKKYGASPTGGCLPMLVQMPILFALYAVIQNVPSYVNAVKGAYEQVAVLLTNSSAIETLKTIKTPGHIIPDASSTESIIDFLYTFNIADWNQLVEKIKDIPVAAVDHIQNITRFIGDVLISDTPWSLIKAHGYVHWIWILPVLVYVTSLLSMKTANAKNQDPDAPGAGQMKTMQMVMPIMSVFFSIALPVGLGIYWIANSLLMTVQQILMNRYIDKIGIEKIVEKNVEKNAERVEKAKVKEGINPGVVSKAASMSTKALVKDEQNEPEEVETPNVEPGTGSISAIARLTDKYKNN